MRRTEQRNKTWNKKSTSVGLKMQNFTNTFQNKCKCKGTDIQLYENLKCSKLSLETKMLGFFSLKHTRVMRRKNSESQSRMRKNIPSN